MRKRIIIGLLIVGIPAVAFLFTWLKPGSQVIAVKNLGTDRADSGRWVFRIENKGPATITLTDACFYETKIGDRVSLITTNNGTAFFIPLSLNDRVLRSGEVMSVSVPDPHVQKEWRVRFLYSLPLSWREMRAIVPDLATRIVKRTPLRPGDTIGEGNAAPFIFGEWMNTGPNKADAPNPAIAPQFQVPSP